MKRSLCLIMAIVALQIAVFTSSAFTVQSSRVYRSADSSGAYVVSFNGSHVDITRYTADSVSAGLNLSYTVSGVCAYHGKIVVFCNDTAHNYLIVYVYYLDTDMLDSFAIYDQKLNNDTDFCCDDNAIYIENHRNNSTFSTVTDLINGSSVYAAVMIRASMLSAIIRCIRSREITLLPLTDMRSSLPYPLPTQMYLYLNTDTLM